MPKKKLPVKAFAEDFRSGLDDASLMAKYELTESKFKEVLNKLVGMEVLSASDLERRSASDPQPVRTPQPSRPTYRCVCPNCRTYWESDEPICPQCKVIVWLSCSRGPSDES